MNSGLISKTLWRAEEAALATSGQLIGAGSWIATGVSIDTRSLEPGDLFVPLVDARDGHDFIAAAFDKGAAATLCASDAVSATPRLQVGDTLDALRGLARAARARTPAKCAAITGSVGKTSVKEALAACLAPQGATHHALRSFNNHIGVPLTLARLPPQSAYAVFEIGMNHRHEIKPLVEMARPHVALISWIAPAHIEHLGSMEAIADEKADIYFGLEPGGAAIVPLDAPYADRLMAYARERAAVVVGAGRHANAQSRLISVQPGPDGSTVEADILGERVSGFIAGAGQHVAHTALLALTATKLLGASLAPAMAALEGLEPAPGRGRARVLTAPFGAFTLVDDAYNANPASVAAALEALKLRAPTASGRRIAALGDMLELGDRAGAYHAGLALPVAEAEVDLVFCAGPHMKALWDALPPHRRGGYAESADSLTPVLLAALRAGDVVLVKGSNGSKMWRVVEALQHLAGL
jgi:UDP-N-acetylmuramoyl-tripeptide--D-alanyl-D-alanine ligase